VIKCCELAPPHVRAIAPYLPGKPISELARELGLAEADIVKLASNENPLGPSPLALAAAQDALHDMALYPDGAGFALKAKLSAKLGVAHNQIVLGNGSNDVLDIAAQAFLSPASSSVHAEHAFAVYPIATQSAGAHSIVVPAKDYGHDLPAMRAAIRDDTRVVWIANPNNPTGTFLPWAEMEAFLEGVPQEVLVVLDEAYGEYLPPAERCDTAAWLARFPNLLITRTFS
jgi:histidinol-phosphate aminotransferase